MGRRVGIGIPGRRGSHGSRPVALLSCDFVCGPFLPNPREAIFLSRFADCCVVGVNLSLPVPLEHWHPFDVLIERDSSLRSRPDLALAVNSRMVPVIGVCRVEPFDGADVPTADAAITELLETRALAAFTIDTRIDVNAYGWRTPLQVESALARMDAVVTTRLHGMVLALKNGVPPLVIDPEPGGGRVLAQAKALEWPEVHTVDSLMPDRLGGLGFCLSAAGRDRALWCTAASKDAAPRARAEFMLKIRSVKPSRAKRLARATFGTHMAAPPALSGDPPART